MNNATCKMKFASTLGSLLLTLALCLAFLPATAYAEEGFGAPETVEDVPPAAAADARELVATSTTEYILKYGNVILATYTSDVLEVFDYGDVVSVAFLGQVIDMPVCSGYSDVDSGTAGLFARDDGYVILAINAGDFATTYGVANKTTNEDGSVVWSYPEGVEGPVSFTIALKQKGGYYDEYVLHQLSYTDDINDYPNLTDDEFANFREVKTTGMGSGVLYRTSSPINPLHKRNEYADAALRRAGVTVVLNLADTEDELASFENYDKTYYASVAHIARALGADVTGEDYKAGLVDEVKYLADNPGVYAVHCLEGKDRAGFAVALLECLMGASVQEVIDDYMTSFYNYYGVTSDDARYDVIAQSNIVKSLQRAFDVDDLSAANLVAEAQEYLLEGGLSAEQLLAVKANLNPQLTYAVSFDTKGRGEVPQVQRVRPGAAASRPNDPVAEGFAFGGWFVDDACAEAYDFANPVAGDMVLYAKWTAVSAQDSTEKPVANGPVPNKDATDDKANTVATDQKPTTTHTVTATKPTSTTDTLPRTLDNGTAIPVILSMCPGLLCTVVGTSRRLRGSRAQTKR